MKRNWDAAVAKIWAEGNRCRKCKRTMKVECAHIIGREHDREEPLREIEIPHRAGEIVVAPDRIVPLCGPATDTATCHGRYDALRFDLLPFLTVEEVLQAVADCASVGENGLEKARMRLCPLAYKPAEMPTPPR